MEKIYLKIKRQDSPESGSYWEDFAVPYRSGMNIILALMEIRKNPVNAKGEAVSAVVWDASCLEEVCGSCTMMINGRPRQACSILVDDVEQPITLEPLTKFPLVRDLVVDRSRMFDDLKKIKAWGPIDGTYDLGPGPRISPHDQAAALELALCTSCGCCLEVCPQYHKGSSFMGAAAVSQTALHQSLPAGKKNGKGGLDALMQEGGLDDCGNAQNCVKVCPKEIPLTTSIAKMGREVTKYALKEFFGK